MKGKWIGKYWFLGNVPQNLKDNKTEFTLIIENYDNSKVSGSIYDNNETGGTKGVGNISGVVKGNKIKFIKRMPIKTAILTDGTRIEEEKPHRKIYYKGVINSTNDYIEGTWKFKRGIGLINRKIVFYPGTNGKWNMKRA